MNQPQARLYLPVTRDDLQRIIDHGPEAQADALAAYRLMSVALMCQAHRQHQRNPRTGAAALLTPALEKGFALLAESHKPHDTAREFFHQAVTQQAVAALMQWMDRNDLALMSDAEIERGHHLTLKGYWRAAYQRERQQNANDIDHHRQFRRASAYLTDDSPTTDPVKASVHQEREHARFARDTGNEIAYRLTREQSRLASRFYAERDEPHQVNAVAGSGKTHQLPMLLEMVPARQRGLIVWSGDQRHTVLRRLPNALRHDTPVWSVADLANDKLRSLGFDLDSGHQRRRQRPNHQLTDTQYAHLLGMHTHYAQGQSLAWWGRLARQTLTRFCYSDAARVDHTHIPPATGRLDPATITRITQLAESLWQLTCKPAATHQLLAPLRLYHKLKMIDLAGTGLVDERRILMVDEAHDMQPVQNRLIERSDSVIWSFGDPLQRTQGLAPTRQHAHRFENPQSLRSPSPMGNVINQLVGEHPQRYELPYSAVGDDTGNVYFYEAHTEVPPGCVMITHTLVDALGHFANLIERECLPRFELATATAMPGLVRALTALYEGQPSYHFELGHFTRWHDFVQRHGRRRAGEAIVRLFKRHSPGEIHALIDRAINQPQANDRITIAHLAAVKNRDYSRVWITGQLLGKLDDDDPKRIGEALSRVYLAMTRASHSLWLPRYFSGWLARQTQGEDESSLTRQ